MATMDGKHMTKDEALELALEALEYFTDTSVSAMDHAVAEDAITAIKQARALDKMADNARELGLDYEPVAPVQEDWGPGPHEYHSLTASVQEPVAWRYRGILHDFDPSDWAEGPVTPLYTTPPNVATPLAAPVVPDVMTTAEGEHPEYVQGWNDCRQLMLQTRNKRHD